MLEPDVAAFVAAQDDLRRQLGTPATFIVDAVPTYPPDTPLDSAGRPLDPTIDPIPGTDNDTRIIKTVTTVFRGTDAQDEPIGWQEGTTLMLDVAIADWDDIKDADRVEVLGEVYELHRGSTPDGFLTADRVRAFASSVA